MSMRGIALLTEEEYLSLPEFSGAAHSADILKRPSEWGTAPSPCPPPTRLMLHEFPADMACLLLSRFSSSI